MNRYIQEANQQFISAYNRYPIILDHGEGMYLYDIDGKRYLDFGSGIGVCGLGYHDPNYTRMLQGQIEKLLHTSNIFYNVPAIEAAKQFNQAANMESQCCTGKSFFPYGPERAESLCWKKRY